MPNRPFPAVKALIRRVERIAANRPEPALILAEVIRAIGTTDADPYEVLGVLVEGVAYTLAEHIPEERRAEAAAELVQILTERLQARGLAR